MRHKYNNYSKILNITGYLLARLQSHLHLKILFMILRSYCFHFDECIKKAQVIFKWGTKGNRGGEREESKRERKRERAMSNYCLIIARLKSLAHCCMQSSC